MPIPANESTHFIPELWSARILAALDKNLVFANLFNRDYEGEISDYGDTVHIGMIATPTLQDYVPGTDLKGPDDVTATEQLLVIDKAKAFNIAVDDIYRVQSRLDLLEQAAARTGQAFADDVDTYLAGLLVDAGTANTGLGTAAAPVAATPENAYKLLIQAKTNLDKANVSKTGRVAVVPPEFEALMLQSPNLYARVDSGTAAETFPGSVYSAAGFTIAVSNNCPTGTGTDAGKTPFTNIVCTSSVQGTYAEQIVKTENYRLEKRFSDAVKGLHVYGAKVLYPEAVAVGTLSFA